MPKDTTLCGIFRKGLCQSMQPVCKPGSVRWREPPRRSFFSECDHSHPLAAYPRRLDRGGYSRRLLGLAPTGVYRAAHVAMNAVGSYPTFSPLPLKTTSGGLFSVALFRQQRIAPLLPRRYLAIYPRSPDFPRFNIKMILKRDRPTDCTNHRNISTQRTESDVCGKRLNSLLTGN